MLLLRCEALWGEFYKSSKSNSFHRLKKLRLLFSVPKRFSTPSRLNLFAPSALKPIFDLSGDQPAGPDVSDKPLNESPFVKLFRLSKAAAGEVPSPSEICGSANTPVKQNPASAINNSPKTGIKRRTSDAHFNICPLILFSPPFSTTERSQIFQYVIILHLQNAPSRSQTYRKYFKINFYFGYQFRQCSGVKNSKIKNLK
jgi:hypothetical protein